MKNKNVHLKCSITIPKDLKINVFDLNIILGNLLNNAIEAIEKAERKYFFINIYFEKNILFIHIENTYDGNIIKEKETLMTTKEEKQLHGLGLKSVSSILENMMETLYTIIMIYILLQMSCSAIRVFIMKQSEKIVEF